MKVFGERRMCGGRRYPDTFTVYHFPKWMIFLFKLHIEYLESEESNKSLSKNAKHENGK